MDMLLTAPNISVCRPILTGSKRAVQSCHQAPTSKCDGAVAGFIARNQVWTVW